MGVKCFSSIKKNNFIISNFIDEFSSYNIVYNDFKNEDSEDYFMILDIPKIGLKKHIFSLSDSRNNIEENVTLLKESLMPDEGTVILASHSGNSSVSFFNNLNKLEIGDEVRIFYDSKEYKYIVDSFKIYSKSDLIFHTKIDERKLIMVTCLDDLNYLIYFAKIST